MIALIGLTDEGMRRLCASQSVLVFNGQSAKAWGVFAVPWRGSPYAAHERQLMISLGCYRVMTR